MHFNFVLLGSDVGGRYVDNQSVEAINGSSVDNGGNCILKWLLKM